MRAILTLLIALGAATAPWASADGVLDSAKTFHKLFLNSLTPEERQNPGSALLHFVPDANLIRASQESSLSQAMKDARASSIDSLAAATKSASFTQPADIDATLKRHPLTMVIVPGIFGEFIAVRPFEDILGESPNPFADQYKKIVEAAAAKGDPNAEDLSYSTKTVEPEELPMDQLVQAGTINDKSGAPLVRVILLYAPYASLETLGDLHERAAMMNRRLEKYLALTGDQDLVLVGYSRGTTYALDMLAQARAERKPWLAHVKGMIGLSGVVWGSTSADQTVDVTQPVSQVLAAVNQLNQDLVPSRRSFWHNMQAYKVFAAKVFQLAKQSKMKLSWQDLKQFASNPLFEAALKIDFLGSGIFLYKELGDLGLRNPINLVTEYDKNIVRAKNLVSAALVGIDQLRTEKRLEWWKTHILPSHVTYYAMTATMADPSESDISKAEFNNSLAFNLGSFEDRFLLKSRDDYEAASGLKLNDSQVAVPQAMFLPNVIHRLNPDQPPLKTEFLGTIGTHHWGAALEIVFDMKDKKLNPFPRAALMRAMAAKVALDMDKN